VSPSKEKKLSYIIFEVVAVFPPIVFLIKSTKPKPFFPRRKRIVEKRAKSSRVEVQFIDYGNIFFFL
jgi:hypothetical protein